MSDIVAIRNLRRVLATYREAERVVQSANDHDLTPTDAEYWARDDAAVNVADLADHLMREVDAGRLMIVEVES